LYICVNNFLSSALPLQVGKIFVSYDVEFSKPSLAPGAGISTTQRTSYYVGPSANQNIPATTATYLATFGNPIYDPLGIGPQSAAGASTNPSSWLMPRGIYKIVLNATYKGTGPTTLSPDLVDMYTTMFKNGNTVTPNVVSQQGGDEYGTWYYTLVVTGMFNSSGNDYMSFNAYWNGVTSTVVALAYETTLIVELA
jgi:hypothetical protein